MRDALRANIQVLFVFLLILGWPALSQAQSVDRIVAVVNGEIITMRQLDNRVNSLMKSQKVGNVGRDEMRQRVLDALIEQELINQAAKSKGVFVTEADISATIESIKKDNNLTDEQFRGSLVHSGTSLEAFRDDIRIELLRNRVLGSQVMSKIVVTDSEVLALLKGEGPADIKPVKSGGGGPIRLIALPVSGDKAKVMAEAKRIKKEIEGGLSFADAAYKYSKGPGFDNGGDPGDAMDLSQLPPQLVSMIESLAPGQPTEPIDGGNGIFIFCRADVAAAATAVADEEKPKKKEKKNKGGPVIADFSVDQIENARRQLERNKMQQRYVEWVTDLKKKAIVKKKL